MLIDPKNLDLIPLEALQYANHELDFDNIGVPNTALKNNRDFISSKNLDPLIRKDLVDVLVEQYSFLDTENQQDLYVQEQIQSLALPNTYTVTTGQQIHIFLGPLYVPHKILSAVREAQKLNTLHPELKFVPIFWMASEDHDFEEIRTLRLWNRDFSWDLDFEGSAVGNLPCNSVAPIADQILQDFRLTEEQKQIMTVFKEVYSRAKDLAQATRMLVHHFFGKYGVVVLDPNDPKLKAHFAPIIQKELELGLTHQAIEKQNINLKEMGLPRPLPARNTSLFFFNNHVRERLDKTNQGFVCNPSGLRLSSQDLLQYPAHVFSPNVALRPLYQETILPNVAYVAGASELMYWMQLPEVFKSFKVNYPVLLLRQHGAYITKKGIDNWEKQGYELKLMLYSPNKFNAFFESSVLNQTELKKLFKSYDALSQELSDYAFKLDKGSVKSLKNEVKHLRKFLVRHFDDLKDKELEIQRSKLNKLLKIRSEMFPNLVFQERITSFLEILLNTEGGLPTEFKEEEFDAKQLWLHVMA